MGAAGPLYDENSVWASLLRENCAPYRDFKVRFFDCFDQNVGGNMQIRALFG